MSLAAVPQTATGLRIDAVPGDYQQHFTHGPERIWTETNCYLDLWIEVLNCLGLDPVPTFAALLSADHDGLSWTFGKQQPEDLRHVPLITSGVVGKQLLVRAYQGDLRKEIRLEPTLISEHFPFLRQGIMAGLGVGIVPDYVVRPELADGSVVATLQDWRLSIFGTSMYLLYMPGRHQTRAVRTCIEFRLDKNAAR